MTALFFPFFDNVRAHVPLSPEAEADVHSVAAVRKRVAHRHQNLAAILAGLRFSR